jgi:RNA polymerase sigma-70 factor (ECF subfamily)
MSNMGDDVRPPRHEHAAAGGGVTETTLLRAARSGDEDAYVALVKPHRPVLLAHCYRMLGSFHDAEDAHQETLLRAWRALPAFEGRSSLRSWLHRVATNVCLRMLERRPATFVLPDDWGPPAAAGAATAAPLTDVPWLEPFPDAALDDSAAPDARYEQREGVELAFVAALQHLPARQRAVLIMRDVLGFSGGEVAAALETTTASVHSALQRAHKTVDERLPARSQQATLRALDDARLRRLVDDYVDAWERSDVDAVVAMLSEEATMAMPPIPTWYAGREAIAAFLRDGPLAPRHGWRLVPAQANGQLTFGHYAWDAGAQRFVAHAIHVLDLDDARVAAITTFRSPGLFGSFGLPDELPPGA